MPHVQNIGTNFFAHRMSYPSRYFPLTERGSTQEIEYPFRTGTSLVLRVPFTAEAVVLGRWTSEKSEEDALSSAIGARHVA